MRRNKRNNRGVANMPNEDGINMKEVVEKLDGIFDTEEVSKYFDENSTEMSLDISEELFLKIDSFLKILPTRMISLGYAFLKGKAKELGICFEEESSDSDMSEKYKEMVEEINLSGGLFFQVEDFLENLPTGLVCIGYVLLGEELCERGILEASEDDTDED